MMNLVVVSIMSAQKITGVETNRESSKGLKIMNGVCVKENFFRWVCSEEHAILNVFIATEKRRNNNDYRKESFGSELLMEV